MACTGKTCLVAGLLPAIFFAFNSPAKTRAAGGFSFATGAAMPKGDLWSVEPRASVGFPLSAGLRVLFGNSCTEPSIFFIPYVVDTKKKGGRNGSFLSVLLGFQVYPYNVLFLQPYFMLGAGYGKIDYEGPSEKASSRNQRGEGRGVSIVAGGGVDFNLYRWFSIGPTFFWNPVWWFDCSRELHNVGDLYDTWLCNPAEDHWILKFWFAGLRVSFNFPE